jgi:SSS family solute:Na+ symporter
MPSQLLTLAQPQASFELLDWAVVIAYFLIVMGVGFWTSRGQTTKRDYFLGGRNLTWPLVGFSIVATETSALTFIGVPAYAIGQLVAKEGGGFGVVGGNMLFIQLILGYVIGRIIIAWKIVPLYFTGDVYTPFQLLNRAFGPQARRTAALLSLLGGALGAGVRVLVTAIPITVVLQLSWPDWNIWLSVVLIMAFALIYTAIGGIKAVVWTDAIQYFIFIGGGLFALFYIPTLIEGGWSTVFDKGAEKMDVFHLGLVGSEQVAAKYGEGFGVGTFLWAQLAELFAGPFNIFMGIFPQTLGILLAFGFDQMNVQRVLGCKDTREGQKAILFSAALIFPQFILFLMIGVCLYVFYSLNGFDFGTVMPWDPAQVDRATGMGPPKSDYMFPIFMVTHIPVAVKGFLIAGLLAAAMSSVSSALSGMASIAVMDFYRPIFGGGNDKAELYVSRAATLVAGIALAIIAVASREAVFVLTLAFQMAGLAGGAILGAFLFGMYRKRGHTGPVIAGMIVSFVFMVFYNYFRTKKAISINWPWDVTIGMTVCISVAWLASIGVPPPTDRSIGMATADED